MSLINIFSWENVLTWFLTDGLKLAFIILIGLLAVKASKVVIMKGLRKAIRKGLKASGLKKEIDEQRERTVAKVIVSVVRLAIWVVVLLTILPELGVNIGPLLAGLGVAGLALGFGARGLISDYISGLFILLEDHFQIGEQVEVAGKKGEVRDFNLRRTLIKGQEGNLYFIPNSQIKFTTNFSRK